MDMAIIFMIVATIAPFLTLHMRKYWFAGVQVILLIGMWIYFIQSFHALPANFSVLWFAFYLSLVVSEVSYVMFAVYLAKKIQRELVEARENREDSKNPISDL
ncbi:MAG TPA: hypothetical protein VFK33_05465 [Bacillales bacterium]|nr:hypothetical protein [Bacillales bacterium]